MSDIDGYWSDINSSWLDIDRPYLEVEGGRVISRFILSSFRGSRRRGRGRFGSVGGYILASTSVSLI